MKTALKALTTSTAMLLCLVSVANAQTPSGNSATAGEVKGPSRIEAGLDFAQIFGTSTFSSNQTIREFAEDGSLKGSYEVGKAPGAGFHVQYNFGPTFAVRLGGQLFSRKSTGTFDASIPHPFFFNQPRTAHTTVTGMGFNESAGTLTAVYRGGGSSKWKVNLEAGVAMFSVSATVASGWSYGQVYPYDTVTLTDVQKVKKNVSPLGIAAGIEFGRELSPSVVAVVQGRFTSGSGDLDVNGQKINVKAGGAQARIGLRFVLARSKPRT